MFKLNEAYSFFVKTDDDFPGMIAYCLYKRAKIEFVKAQKEKNPELDVIPQEIIEGFKTGILNNTVGESLQETAERLLSAYADDILELDRNELKEEYSSRVEEWKNLFKKQSFWKKIWTHVFGDYIYIVTLALFVLVLYVLGITPKIVEAIKTLFHL